MKRAAKPIDLTLEREVQADCIRLYESLGCEVVVFAQHGRLGSGTRQTPGIADLRVYCRRKRASWWHEVKGPSGEQSDAQRKFQALVEACGETYQLGGIEAGLEQLRAIGLVPAGGPVVLAGRALQAFTARVLLELKAAEARDVPRHAPVHGQA